MMLPSAFSEVDFTHYLVSFISLPVHIKDVGIPQTMLILFFLHCPLSLTPLIVWSEEGGYDSGGGGGGGEIAFTLIN